MGFLFSWAILLDNSCLDLSCLVIWVVWLLHLRVCVSFECMVGPDMMCWGVLRVCVYVLQGQCVYITGRVSAGCAEHLRWAQPWCLCADMLVRGRAALSVGLAQVVCEEGQVLCGGQQGGVLKGQGVKVMMQGGWQCSPADMHPLIDACRSVGAWGRRCW